MKKRDRLRRHGDFQRVLGGGRLYSGRTLVGFAVPSPGATPRVGVTVSRNIRGSVRRNRAKRRLREMARLELLANDSSLRERGISYDVVLIARPPALEAGFSELIEDGRSFLARLGRLGRLPRRPPETAL